MSTLTRPSKMIAVLVNKESLSFNKIKLFNGVIAKLRALQHVVKIYSFTSVEEGQSLSRECAADQSINQLVIAGGDGTINIILRGWNRYDIPIALIPLGTCNLFAAECGYKKDVDQIVKIIDEDHRVEFFIAKANDSIFTTVAGCGFDSQVCNLINWRWKNYFGRMYFFYLSLKYLIKRDKPSISVAINNQKAVEFSSVIIAKGHYYAGKFSFAPKASIFAPSLYLLAYQSNSTWRELRIILSFFAKRIHTIPEIVFQQVEQVEILSELPQPVQLDGDIVLSTPVKIIVNPSPYSVCVPRFQ